MHILLATLNPWVVFAKLGRLGHACFCLLLQLTLVGWIPAALWAIHAIRQEAATPRKLRTFNIIPGRATHQRTA